MFELSAVLNFILFLMICVGSYALKQLHKASESYIKSFGSEAGKIEALTKKLDEVSLQQALLTRVTETVKNDIEHQAWMRKESISLKTRKLEEFIIEFIQDQDVRHQHRDMVVAGNRDVLDQSSNLKLKMLRYLYLPELKDQHEQYEKLYTEFLRWSTESQYRLADAEDSEINRVREAITIQYEPILVKFSKIKKDVFIVSAKLADSLTK